MNAPCGKLIITSESGTGLSKIRRDMLRRQREPKPVKLLHRDRLRVARSDIPSDSMIDKTKRAMLIANPSTARNWSGPHVAADTICSSLYFSFFLFSCSDMSGALLL